MATPFSITLDGSGPVSALDYAAAAFRITPRASRPATGR